MDDSKFYYGRGTADMFDDYMDFCNYVFGFNGSSKDFKKLLPKLYKEEYHPVESSYVVVENGKLKAAVGAYDSEIEICGQRLKCRGIGNVAVHPYARSKGYMKKLMNMSFEDMKADGVDFSELGGRRQRYNYFGYEKSGTAYQFSINDDNIRHTFGTDRKQRFIYKKISTENSAELDDIYALIQKQNYKPIRERKRLFDILSSWSASVYVAYEKDRFVGYCTGEKISEIMLTCDEDILDFIVGIYDYLGQHKLEVTLPEFRQVYISKLYLLAEGYSINPSSSFNVLNYRNVLLATVKLKSTYMQLLDGETVLLIHGMAGDERIKIEIHNGKISIEYTNEVFDTELSHIEAINYLFSPICPIRNIAKPFAKLLLPLPLWIYYPDGV